MRLNRFIALLVAIITVFAVIPFGASAASDSVVVAGIRLTDGKYLAIDAIAPTSSKPSGGYAYYKNGVLTLHDYKYSGLGGIYLFNPNAPDSESYVTCVFSDHDLDIVLEGDNALENISQEGECISVRGNLSITSKGDGNITMSGYYGVYCYEFTKSVSLTLDAEITVANAFYGVVVDLQGGEGSFGSLNVEGGTCTLYDVTVGAFLYCDDNSEVVFSGGNFFVKGEQGIYVYSEGDSSVKVDGTTVSIEATDDGIIFYGENHKNQIDIDSGVLMIEAPIVVNCQTINLNGGAFKGVGSFICEEAYWSSNMETEGSMAADEFSAVQRFSLGDVNFNGKIEKYDYILVKRYCLGTVELDLLQMIAADVNGRDDVEKYDYILIKRHCLGTYVITDNEG